MRAIRAYGNFYEKMYPGLIELGDTQGAMQGKAAKMAGTLKSNLDNLQTAFVRFADGNLTAPLAKLADFLNKLSEDPKRVEAVFNSIKRGLLVIGGIKIGAGVMSFLSTLKNFKGGNANITEQINLAGSAGSAMPVFVTNWGSGGAAGGSAPLGRPPGAGGLLDQYGNPIGANPKPQPVPPGQPPNGKGKWNLNKPNWKGAAKAGAGAAAVTALMTVPGMIGELSEISKNGEMTKEEKSIARGGAIGETVGSIGGAAAGALAGAAIGSVVPVVGTAIGALVGGLIGQFGGPVGRFIGEKVGAAVGKEVEDKVPEPTNLPPAITDYAPYAPAPQNIKMDGQVGFDVNVSVQDDRIKTDAYFTGGDIPEWLNPGNARAARGYN
jgi:phage tail tape-measure protein